MAHGCSSRSVIGVLVMSAGICMLFQPATADPAENGLGSGLRWAVDILRHRGSSTSGSNSSAPAYCSTGPLVGCSYRVRGGDTLLTVAGSLDVEMDVLQAFNPQFDITAQDFFSSRNGQDLAIPCPGTTYLRFLPVYIAGCFFSWRVTEDNPTLLSLAQHPPNEVPGPYSIKGIWTANYQSTGVDLTQPGQYYVGREIYLPTCGHSGILHRPVLDNFPTLKGCSYTAGGPNTTSPCPITLGELATSLRISGQELLDLNPGLGLSLDSVIAPAGYSGSQVEAQGKGSNSTIVSRLNIPCPSKGR